MNKLQELLTLCKCGVSININDYRNAYESVENAINTIETIIEEPLEPETISGMIETQNVIEIHCYPFTPISSITVYHYNIELAIEEMINAINEWQKEREA